MEEEAQIPAPVYDPANWVEWRKKVESYMGTLDQFGPNVSQAFRLIEGVLKDIQTRMNNVEVSMKNLAKKGRL